MIMCTNDALMLVIFQKTYQSHAWHMWSKCHQMFSSWIFALVTMAPTSGVSSHLITQSGHVETEPSHTKHYCTYSTDITDIPLE